MHSTCDYVRFPLGVISGVCVWVTEWCSIVMFSLLPNLRKYCCQMR